LKVFDGYLGFAAEHGGVDDFLLSGDAVLDAVQFRYLLGPIL
jgi:hypothetical protein